MKIVQTRRISQIFFFCLFVWLCIVSTIGDKFWQIRAWPVNWFVQLDPLVAVGTMLSTQTLYWPLLWALVTVALTIVFGRFFCSWVCPFGSMHHFFGYLGKLSKTTAQKIALNKYRKAQCIKYYVLVFFLIMAAFPSVAASLQTGLLDPIPLVTRSFNLLLLPIADRAAHIASATARFYEGGWLILAIFLAALFANFVIPRFYCRFVCPLGALFGLIDRFAIWRIGKRKLRKRPKCTDCRICEQDCEGGCEPADQIRISECVLCFNCLDDCKYELVSYQTQKSLSGEMTDPDISRRGFVLSIATGALALPALRLANKLGANWYHRLIRPPGALAEEEFLKRCIKCGQCMRICPTNVIQPAGIQGGLENLWTPVLNNRIGSSGCQLNCVACGQVCPTAAIRPIKIEEKLGTGEFSEAGPIKLGTAFVDRSRCLPWAFDKPCIVCQENCPVSPKAIFTRDYFATVRDGLLTVKRVSGSIIETVETALTPEAFATGDYYCATSFGSARKITANTENSITLEEIFEAVPLPGDKVKIQICLQRPYVDIERCIGCGVCEHECPVSGKRAIRVSAEGESRSRDRRLLI